MTQAETKERATLTWPAPADEGPDAPRPDLTAAREALAAEWHAANPQTPEEIQRFYWGSRGIGPDLEAWHRVPERQEWTRMLVHVATEAHVQRVVDIGCGAGHDLLALHEALPDHQMPLEGVEPNTALRVALPPPIVGLADVREASIEWADLLVCIDVLEHVPDPETFLGDIAQRAPMGCLLFESTASFDGRTPLHLAANYGWHPGRVLERNGWEIADQHGDQTGRVRVWRRVAATGRQRASVLLCAYRSVSVDSLQSVMGVTAGSDVGWRLKVKSGDALIARSRAVLLTDWWRSTGDDVALMVDDDISFSPRDADHITELCRNGYDVICGAYPVRNGAHLALRTLAGTDEVRFGPHEPPLEIRYPATGFVAIHRRVVDALISGAADPSAGPMPLCHPHQTWSFYNLFPTMVIDDGADGPALLSEDWGLGELVRRAGFKVWLDPTVRLQHSSALPVSVSNMAAVQDAIAHA